MWNISLDDIVRAKEEAKGRRAAIEARYTAEIKALETDLAEIETLERVATAFASRHKADAEAEADAVTTSHSQPIVEPQPEPEAALVEEPTEGRPAKNSSRWRLHFGEERADA
jgi:hypothetical protein